jgi:polysaccharide pyruvyl transferase WcaK-like protein
VQKQVDSQYANRITTADNITHPQRMLAEVSRCHLLIGMRLHSLIYAASQQVPMLGISYDPKIDQFLNRLGMTATASTSSIDASYLASEAVKLFRERSEWQIEKQSTIDRLKSEAQTPAKQIALFFCKGRDQR